MTRPSATHQPERQEAKKLLMAPTKLRRNHEKSGAMASASLTNPFFEVPFRHFSLKLPS